ncbi:hypothetical protein MHH28_02515 [Paenibacillus sp. FSL K6-1217]|uniref:hypothetical protein n=1 Tax=Paenibacillus sp. FSL K6-1217 TaxID=2921466 RepID=UPI0032567A07
MRNDGGNVVFADGLLLEPRTYTGPVRMDITKFGIEEGAPTYLTRADEIAGFYDIVEQMTECYSGWDMPSLIVNYADGKFEINDECHNNVALHQMNITYATVIFWTSSEADQRYVLECLSEERTENV